MASGPAWRHDLRAALWALPALLAWDASGADLWLARAVGGAAGFPLRDHPLLVHGLHDGGRLLALALLAALALHGLRPLFGGQPRRERVAWLAATLAAAVGVTALKQASATSCPWDLALFGGVAEHLSHWRWGVADGGGGRCFPSGHAVSAFAWFSGWFALRARHPVAARRWLLGVWVAGGLFGATQVLRGAHFASHVAWSAWLCWVIAATAWRLAAGPRASGPRPVGQQAIGQQVGGGQAQGL